MNRLAALAAPVLSLVLVGCGGDSAGEDSLDTAAPAAGGVDIRGKITEIATPLPDVTTGALVVEGELEADTRYPKAWVRLKETTVILRRQGTETIPATMADLQVGARVEVKFEGVVAELDPVQASAGEITIID